MSTKHGHLTNIYLGTSSQDIGQILALKGRRSNRCTTGLQKRNAILLNQRQHQHSKRRRAKTTRPCTMETRALPRIRSVIPKPTFRVYETDVRKTLSWVEPENFSGIPEGRYRTRSRRKDEKSGSMKMAVICSVHGVGKRIHTRGMLTDAIRRSSRFTAVATACIINPMLFVEELITVFAISN